MLSSQVPALRGKGLLVERAVRINILRNRSPRSVLARELPVDCIVPYQDDYIGEPGLFYGSEA